MTIQEAEVIVKNSFKNQSIDFIEDASDEYYLVLLKSEDPHAMDIFQMLNKQTGEIRPYNPTLLKGKTK